MDPFDIYTRKSVKMKRQQFAKGLEEQQVFKKFLRMRKISIFYMILEDIAENP